MGGRARNFGEAILVLCEHVRTKLNINLIDEPSAFADLFDLEIHMGKGNTADLSSKCQGK